MVPVGHDYLVKPMLATPALRPGGLPGTRSGPKAAPGTWTYEVKWDGMRILADAGGDGVRLFARSGHDMTPVFPELRALAGLGDVLLDGEVVAFDDAGRPDFAVLAERIGRRDKRSVREGSRIPIRYLVFDVMRCRGIDLTANSLSERRQVLEALPLPEPASLSPWYPDGEALLTATKQQGLEGVVAKRLASRYQAGIRSDDWVKAPHKDTRVVVIGGWKPQADTVSRPGAVLVGAPDGEGRLRYLGKVGSGIGPAAGRILSPHFARLATGDSPFFDEIPREHQLEVTWLRPELTCQIRHLGFTGPSKLLRQPAFQGLRDEVEPDPFPHSG